MWIFLLFIAINCNAQPLKFLDYLHQFETNQIVGSGVFSHSTPSYAQLKQDRDNFSDYEQFVNHLLSLSTTLKDNFVLIYRSESQQLSSPEFPRIILFGGGNVFAFSEDPLQKDRRVEIMEVEPVTYKISMHEIVFKPNNIEFHDNPKSCIACHGQPAKPLWNPYDFWPNTFGSAVGRFGTHQEKDAYAHIQKNPTVITKLINIPETLNLNNENVTAFTQYIHQINLGRWINENLKPDRFSKGYAYPLMAALNFCTSSTQDDSISELNLLSYFRPEERSSFKLNYQMLLKDVRENRIAFKAFLDRTLNDIFPNPDYISRVDHNRLIAEVEQTAQLHYVLDAAGFETGNLVTSPMNNSYFISSPSNAFVDFITTLFELRPDLFEDIKWKVNDLGTGQASWITVDCDTLKQKSLLEARAIPTSAWRPSSLMSFSQPVLNRCAQCHVHNSLVTNQIPYLPFNNMPLFVKQLRDPTLNLKEKNISRVSSHDNKQMPPERALTPEEVESLKGLLETLIN